MRYRKEFPRGQSGEIAKANELLPFSYYYIRNIVRQLIITVVDEPKKTESSENCELFRVKQILDYSCIKKSCDAWSRRRILPDKPRKGSSTKENEARRLDRILFSKRNIRRTIPMQEIHCFGTDQR